MTEMWFLVYTEAHNAYDLVEKGSIICAGDVAKGDVVTFFYKNKPFVGEITEISESYEKLNQMLKELGAPARHTVSVSKSVSTTATPSEVLRKKTSTATPQILGKRTRTQTSKFSAPSSSKGSQKKPALSEEEAKRMRILNLNKTAAIKNTNAAVMTMIMEKKKKADNDPDYNPVSLTDSESELVPAQLTESAKTRKFQRMHGLTPITPKLYSPSKEDLKQEVLQLKMKLQFAYDSIEDEKEEAAGDKQKKKGNSAEVAPASPGSNKPAKPKKNEESEMPTFLVDDHQLSDNEVTDDHGPSAREVDNKSERNKAGQSEEEEQKSSPTASVHLPSSTFEYPELDYQLRGSGEGMLLLHRGIYCRKKDLHDALKLSTSVTHAVRRMMVGVFNPSELANVTLSGTHYKPGGKKAAVDPLHPLAIQAIVDYANEAGKKMGWKGMKLRQLSHTISVKLNEIKKAVLKGSVE